MIDSIRDRIVPEHRPPLPSVDLDADDLHHALACERRRILVDFVAELPDGIELSNVAEYVAVEELDTTFEELSYAERKRVYVALYQGHVPKLDDLGVVEFTDDGEVYPTERTAAVAEIARAVDEAAGGDGA